MGNRHPAAWRDPDTRYQPHVLAAIAQGYGKPAYWHGIETFERAQEIYRGLHRARRQLGESMSITILDAPGGTYTVQFTPHDKQAARRYIKQAGRWNPKPQ